MFEIFVNGRLRSKVSAKDRTEANQRMKAILPKGEEWWEDNTVQLAQAGQLTEGLLYAE